MVKILRSVIWAIPCLLSAAPATAQTADPRRDAHDSVAAGASVGWIFMSPRWTTWSGRLSVPLHRLVSVDLEVGASWDPSECCRIGEGLTGSAIVRLSRAGRLEDGLMRYWLVGGVSLEQRRVDESGQPLDPEPIRTVQFGYGWDWKRGRIRHGLELSGFGSGHQIGAVRYLLFWN